MIKVTTKFDVYDGIKTRLIFILMVIDIVVSIGWYAVCMYAQFSAYIAHTIYNENL